MFASMNILRNVQNILISSSSGRGKDFSLATMVSITPQVIEILGRMSRIVRILECCKLGVVIGIKFKNESFSSLPPSDFLSSLAMR